jgi:hypothetical protein
MLYASRIIRRCPGSALRRRLPGWKFFSRNKVLCPAFAKEEPICWLVPRTHCPPTAGEDYFEKLAHGLVCSYFLERGERHPQGGNVFFTEQLRRYTNPDSGDVEFEGIIKDISYRKKVEEARLFKDELLKESPPL